ncbi:MAG: hypothetical protein HXY23_12975 [Parvularculaceae bacterium]|nr:hypothetical protein [Parvularculaceae bacterium]
MRNLITAARRHKSMRTVLLAGAALAVTSAAIAQYSRDDDDYTLGDEDAPLRLKSDYYGYSASISPRAGYTTNVNLSPDGLEEGSAYFSTVLQGSAIYSKPRLTGIISGTIDLSYITEDSNFGVNQDVGGAATLTVVDNLLYVDAAGSTARQLFGDNARFSQNINAARDQRANVHTYSASPYLYREFEDASNATLRYRYSQVFIDDGGIGANPFGGDDFLNDSRSHEALAGWSSGSKWQRVRLGLAAYGNKTRESGSIVLPVFEFDQGSVMAEGQIALTEVFGLSGAFGYDEIDTKTASIFFNDDDLSGVFWRAGFFANPGRRTNLRVEYGERFDNDFIDASISYRLGNRVTFSAGAGQSFESRAQYLNTQFIASQRSVLEFAEALREGGSLSPTEVIQQANRFAGSSYNAQTSGIGVNENAWASLRGAFDRTEISLYANYSDTDFGYRQTRYFGGGLDLRRELSRRMLAYGGLFLRNAETTIDQATCQTSPFLFGFDVTAPLFDPVAACVQYALNNGETTTVGGRIGLAYRIQENLSAFGEFAHTQRFAADYDLLEYGENAFLAGLTLEF